MQNASAAAQHYQNVPDQRSDFHLKRQSSEYEPYQYTSLLKPNVEKERTTMSQQVSHKKIEGHMKEDASRDEANKSTIEHLEKKRAAGGGRRGDESSEMKDHNQIIEHSTSSFTRECDASPSKNVEAKPRISPELEAQR